MNEFYMLENGKWAEAPQYATDYAQIEAEWDKYKSSFSIEDDSARAEFIAAWVKVDATSILYDEDNLISKLLDDIKHDAIGNDTIRGFILDEVMYFHADKLAQGLLPGTFEKSVRTETISPRFTKGELLLLDTMRGRTSRSDYIIELMKKNLGD